MASIMQALIDGFAAQERMKRANSQMTLGKLISLLNSLDEDLEVEGLICPHSYRGYYTDLAFSTTDVTFLASHILATVKECLGKTFEGYKGGEFAMEKTTPIWIATRGSTGVKLMGLSPNRTWFTKEDN